MLDDRKICLVLNRRESDGIGLEDIDTLQMELEAMLTATVVRKMILKEESKNLAHVENFKGASSAKSGKRVGPESRYEGYLKAVVGGGQYIGPARLIAK